jgi:hypothetical protein
MLRKDSSPANLVMLSNLRFDVIARNMETDDLVLDLLPRSSKGIPVKQVAEASFLLVGVDILPRKMEVEAETRVTLEAEYVGYDEVFEDFVTVKMHPDPEGNEEGRIEPV